MSPVRRIPLVLIGSSLFVVVSAVSQEAEVLILPDDQHRLDELERAGTVWIRQAAGLTRVEVPQSSDTYYVIDLPAVLQASITESLESIWGKDSDIRIRFGVFGDEIAHLRRVGEHFDVQYLRFEEALPIQLRRFFEKGRSAGGDRFVEMEEYRIPSAACPELSSATHRVESELRRSVSTIGGRPEAEGPKMIIVDGAYYRVNVKFGRFLEGQFGVGENAGPLHDALQSLASTLRECRTRLEPRIRRVPF